MEIFDMSFGRQKAEIREGHKSMEKKLRENQGKNGLQTSRHMQIWIDQVNDPQPTNFILQTTWRRKSIEAISQWHAYIFGIVATCAQSCTD